MFELKFETSSAAFDADPVGEIANVLSGIAVGFWTGKRPVPGKPYGLKDANGNTVGTMCWTPEDPDND